MATLVSAQALPGGIAEAYDDEIVWTQLAAAGTWEIEGVSGLVVLLKNDTAANIDIILAGALSRALNRTDALFVGTAAYTIMAVGPLGLDGWAGASGEGGRTADNRILFQVAGGGSPTTNDLYMAVLVK